MGFVHGMGAIVLGLCRGSIIARAEHFGHEEDALPVALGVCQHVAQCTTLPDITLWLDDANVPAVAYVALSRAERDGNLRYVGDLSAQHCIPAD